MLANTYTTDQLVERLGLMRKYLDKILFQKQEDITIREVIQNECDEHTVLALESWQNDFDEKSIQPLVVYEALEAVQEDLGGLPSVTLYVPVRFNPDQVEKLGVWFRENVQPNILLSLHVDPRATGGCSFIWKDVYHDFSLRYFIEKERNEINEMFNIQMHAR